jgi:orotidine-5'-phosphate decarboxylase
VQASTTSADKLTEAARQRIILAVDAPDLESARALVEPVRPYVGALKIGKELFTRCGPEALRVLGGGEAKIFLDLKYHDIPNTVAGAVRAAARVGAHWVSLHIAGGAAMLEAAVAARDASPEPRPKLLGVTVLTSDASADPEEVVERALLAQRCGLDGAIASPREVARLRAACGPDFLLVTPGVRPAGVEAGDQRRVATPGSAIRDGADLLVIGRPISAAADPSRLQKRLDAKSPRSWAKPCRCPRTSRMPRSQHASPACCVHPKRFSKDTFCCPPDCTAIVMCSAPSSCSIRGWRAMPAPGSRIGCARISPRSSSALRLAGSSSDKKPPRRSVCERSSPSATIRDSCNCVVASHWLPASASR